MWFTFRRMIPGWFTGIPSWRGQDGIRTLESGLGARIFRSELALESDGGAVLDGDGVIGDSTGITITRDSAVEGTTPGAGRSITGAHMLAADLLVAVVSTVPEELDHSMETGRRLEDMLRRAARAECARAPSAATTAAEKRGASRRAAGPALGVASMAAEGSTVAEGLTEADDVNQ